MEQTSVGIVLFFLVVLGQMGASISGKGSASVDLEVVASMITGKCTEDEIGAVRRRTGAVTIAVVGCMGVAAEIVGNCTKAEAGSVEWCTEAVVAVAAWIL